MRKLISCLLAVVMLISLLPDSATVRAEDGYEIKRTIYFEDFETYSGGEAPEDIEISGNTESVFVDMVGTSKRLWLKNSDDIAPIGIRKRFPAVSDSTAVFGVDYLQIGRKSDGDQILGVYSGDTALVSVETKNGNIVLRSNNSEDGYTLVSNYYCNRAYCVEVSVDLYNKNCAVNIDSEQIGRYPLLDISKNTVDNMAVKATYSPGFAIDNVTIAGEAYVSNIIIEGTQTPVIPNHGTERYTYTAQAIDANGQAVEDIRLTWSLTNAPSGVELETDGTNQAVVTVSEIASEKAFSLAAAADSGLKGTLTLQTEKLKASGAKIQGWHDKALIYAENGEDGEVSYPSFRMTSDSKYAYTIKVYNQHGEEVSDCGAFRWELYSVDGEELPSGIGIDKNTGVVTVSGEVSGDTYIGIRATSVENPSIFDTCKLQLSDYATYTSDKIRLDAVIAHVESVLECASDEDSPLLADLIVRQTRAPGSIPVRKTNLISSNVMSQSNLMRTMENLSAFTDNPTYKNKVKDIYRYLLTNCISSAAIVWGGHTAMDLTANAQYIDSDFGYIHEIKGCIPYMKPLFDEAVNLPYTLDVNADGSEKNGGGYAGFLARTILAGHAAGNVETLAFERHYAPRELKSMEDKWTTPEVFDSERQGPVVWENGASFLIVTGGLISVLLDYYRGSGDENALRWAENCMRTVLNSAYTYYVTDAQGNPVIDPNTGKQKTWTEGIFNECFTTTKGLEYRLHGYDEGRSNAWYEISNYMDYTGPQYGDRFYNNVIYGDGWVQQGICTEEEGELMLEPYMATRENSCITQCATAFCGVINEIAETDTDKATELMLQYSKSIYNYLKLRYNFNSHYFDAYMTWIRPDKMNGQTEYVETEENEPLDKSRYFSTVNVPVPHNGYYYTKGSVWNGKMPEIELVATMTQLVATTRARAAEIEETQPEDAQLLYKRSRFIWKVLRDLCLNLFDIGDIGEDLDDLQPKLDYDSTAYSTAMLYSLIEMYKGLGRQEYLDMARAIANNYVAAYYSDSEKLFISDSDYLTTGSNMALPLLLELEALIRDDYDSCITAKATKLGEEFFDVYTEGADGAYRRNAKTLSSPATLVPNLEVKAKELHILHDEIKLGVGECAEIKYEVIPFDADDPSVIWDIDNRSIANIDQSTDMIYGLAKGKTKIRLVSSSALGVASQEVTVIVE